MKLLFGIVILAIACAVNAIILHKASYESERSSRFAEFAISDVDKTICAESDDVVQCVNEYIRSFRNMDREEFENSIQHESADWAFGALLISTIGLGVSGLGLYWISETLGASRAAVDAARAANDLNRESIRIAERAWITSKVYINGVREYSPDGHWYLPIGIKNTNSGRTPAIGCYTRVQCSTMDNIAKTIKKIIDDDAGDDGTSGITIAPNDDFDRYWIFSTDQPFFAPEYEGDIADFVVGLVTYKTVFSEEKRRTVFVYSIFEGIVGTPSDGEDGEFRDGGLDLLPWSGSFNT